MTDELSPPEQRRIRALFRTRSSSPPAASRQDSATTTAAPTPCRGGEHAHHNHTQGRQPMNTFTPGDCVRIIKGACAEGQIGTVIKIRPSGSWPIDVRVEGGPFAFDPDELELVERAS